jgi:hypothetical protein
MKPSLKILSCLILVLIFSWAGQALATQYLNLVAGTEKWFVAGNPAQPYAQVPIMHTVVSRYDGGIYKFRREVLLGDRVLLAEDRLYNYNAEGDIFYLGNLPNPDLDHPILWVDAPLTVGKTWKDSRPADEWSNVDNTIQYEFRVLEQRAIPCPMGTFKCYRVNLLQIYPDGMISQCNFWYNESCGLVMCCMEDNRYFRLRKVIPGDASDPDEIIHEEELVGDVFGVPNPANPMTTITFELKEAARVEAAVFDLSGRRVKSLINGEFRSAGQVAIPWQGVDDRGSAVASGTYLVRVIAGQEVSTTRVSLVR